MHYTTRLILLAALCGLTAQAQIIKSNVFTREDLSTAQNKAAARALIGVQPPDLLMRYEKVTSDTNEWRLLCDSYGVSGFTLLGNNGSVTNTSDVTVIAEYGDAGVPQVYGSGLRYTTDGSMVGTTADPGGGKVVWTALTTNGNASLSAGYLVMVGYKSYAGWPITGATVHAQVWRDIGTNSTLVAEQDITSKLPLPSQINYAVLNPSIAVESGDRVGIAVTYDGSNWGYVTVFSAPTATNCTRYYQAANTLTTRPETGFDWTAGGATSTREFEVETFVSSTPRGTESLGSLASGATMHVPLPPHSVIVRAESPGDGVVALLGVPGHYTQITRPPDRESRANHCTYSADGSTDIGADSDPGSGKIYSAAVSYSTQTRITRPGRITQVTIPTTAYPTNSQWWFQLWRNVGASSTLVYEEDVPASIAGGIGQRACVLTNTCYAHPYDYLGVCVKYDGTNWGKCIEMGAVVSGDGSGFYNGSNMLTNKPSDGHDWTGSLFQSSRPTLIEAYIEDVPMMVAIGDSLINGRYSGATTARTNVNVLSMPSEYASTMLGWYIENMGIGSQQSTDINTRFAADVIAKGPRLVWIHAGINDLAYLFKYDPVVTNYPSADEIADAKSDFLGAYTNMITAALAAGIRVVITEILPWDPNGLGSPWMDDCLPDGNTTLTAVRDDWMSSLAEYVSTFDDDDVLLIDCSPALADESGYLRDEYQRAGDGYIHLNELGARAWGEYVADAITEWLREHNLIL